MEDYAGIDVSLEQSSVCVVEAPDGSMQGVSPVRNSSATWRLNATLWDRCCLAMGLFPKTRHPGQFRAPYMSGPRGALQIVLELAL